MKPPFNEDAEQAVLAAMLIDERALVAARGALTATDFYAERHRTLYTAMCAVADRGATVDPLTLSHQLEDSGALHQAGGKDYLGFLVDCIPTAANVRYHAGIVREMAHRRAVLVALHEAGELVQDGKTAQAAAAAAFSALLPFTVDDTQSAGFVAAKDSVWGAVQEIEGRANGTHRGLKVGIPAIDAETNGFRDGELVILAGAEKMGKSAAALNFALRVADTGQAAAYVSAEMTRETLIERCLAWKSGVSLNRIGSGKLVDTDWSELAAAGGWLSKLPLWIDDEAEPSLADVHARCTHLKAMHPELRLIVVDFLQLIHDRERGVGEAVELKRVAYGLKRLAKRLRVCVVAPCQVNSKDVEELKDARPRLKDLQGSSGMRQAADFIALLYREGAYNAMAPDTIEFNFAACRRTAPFRAMLLWNGATQRITP